jgi:hypothetical protein
MSANLGPKGLQTFANELQYPEQALQEAENVVIDKDGVAQPRRGFAQYGAAFGTGGSRAKQLSTYKDRLILHQGSTLEFDNGSGTFVPFTGSYTEPELGVRMKSKEANGNYFFTTTAGIKKIAAASASDLVVGSITKAGGIKALDLSAQISYRQAGFFSFESKVVYRIVWGYKDNNNNLILGTPSARSEAVNRSTTATGVVKLDFTIPTDVALDIHFYQIYRSAVVGVAGFSSVDDIAVDDELQLVIEDFPSSAELTAGKVSLFDTTPDDFRKNGTPLYTNVNTGSGILQANELPPLAKDIELFKGSMFYANTKTVHRKQINLLSVSGFTSDTSEFVISNGTTTVHYKFVGIKEVFTVDTAGFGGVIPGGLYGKYWTCSSANNEKTYYIWYSDGVTTPDPAPNVDYIGIEIDISTAITQANVASITKSTLDANPVFVYDFNSTIGTTLLTFTATNAGKEVDVADGAVSTGFTFATLTQGDGEDTTTNPKQIKLSALLTPGQQIDDTARSLSRIINKDTTSPVIANYISNASDIPGQISFESKVLNDTQIYFGVNDTNITSKFNPSLPLVRTASLSTGVGTVNVSLTAHGFTNGTKVVLYSSTSIPALAGVYTVAGATANAFNISATVTASGTTEILPTTEHSDNEVSPNRVYYSKYQQPEAVPLLNYIDVGPKDEAIDRIVALRDSLFVFKGKGIYRLYGGQAPDFSVTLFDNSAAIIAPDSASILNNKVYALTTQGVITVSETGVNIISRSIEDKLNKLNGFSNVRTASFSIASETDRAYFLWTIKSITDTLAPTCYRFNVFTGAWTEWPIAKACAIRNPGDDKIYLGPVDINQLEQERKTFQRQDYTDRQYSLSIGESAVSGNTLILSSTSLVTVGDALIQYQYVTPSDFNRLLNKLDADPGLDDGNYFALLEMLPGDILLNKMNALKLKLDADDTGETYPASVSNDYAILQTDYNVIIGKLNGFASNAFYKTYPLSVGITEVEGLIATKTFVGSTVTLTFVKPFLFGPVTLYKAIKTKITWVPQHFGDPNSLKQISEGTFIFRFNNFSSGTISYNSDLEQNFEKIPFNSFGPGMFGGFNFGGVPFGGQGNKGPFRTYVPRTKQKCRFLQCRFEHSNALEFYELFGITFNPRIISTRSYR